MHRLINARNLYPSGLHSLQSTSTNFVKTSIEQKCSFCDKILLHHGTKGKSAFIYLIFKEIIVF